MGQAFLAQVVIATSVPLKSHSRSHTKMAPMKAMKKAMKAAGMKKAGTKMSKSGIAQAIADEHQIKRSAAAKIIDSLATIGATEVKKEGIFVFPGFCRIKTRRKPATKACKREVFGEMRLIKARPARTIVKAFPVSALKKSVL